MMEFKNHDLIDRFDYEGMFGRNNASAHFGSAKVRYEW